MAKVTLVDKRVQLTRSEIIKFQIVLHCYFKNLVVSDADYNCLTLLAALGESDLTEFCNLAAKHSIFKSTQTVRNCLIKMEKMGLISKRERSKKKISLDPELAVVTKGNVLLNYKILHVEPQEA